jgi:acyl-CoA thioester hydrolase
LEKAINFTQMSKSVTTKIQIRFSDVDSMGHVNNAVYLNYFEYARMMYINELVGDKWDWINKGMLLANNNIDYFKPLLLQDLAEIETKCIKIGTKSFVLEYVLYVTKEGQRIKYTSGTSTLVSYDYTNNCSIEVPEELKTQLL